MPSTRMCTRVGIRTIIRRPGNGDGIRYIVSGTVRQLKDEEQEEDSKKKKKKNLLILKT